MRLITATVPPNCDIALHGDIHRGNVASSLSGLQETFDWIMDKPDRRFVMMGDAIEAITTDDKRFHSGSTNEQIPMRQATAMVREYEAVKGRGLAWLSGNHEFMLHRVGDFGYAMAGNLGIPYGGRACRLTLQDKRGPFAKMYLIHPSRWTIRSRAKDFEQRQANLKASVKQFMVDKASDCVVMAVGHTHRLLVVQPSKKRTGCAAATSTATIRCPAVLIPTAAGTSTRGAIFGRRC
jgi:UDP-2,3-diacylglucosamine pyrophosphatase LpxH